MSISHIQTNSDTLRVMFSHIEQGRDTLAEITGTMALMIDTDGSHDADYQVMANAYGYATALDARNGFNELLALKGHLIDDTTVNSATLQALNKFRQP